MGLSPIGSGSSKSRGVQDGDAEHRVGEGGSWLDPKKKIVTSPKLGLFLGRKSQEASTPKLSTKTEWLVALPAEVSASRFPSSGSNHAIKTAEGPALPYSESVAYEELN
jgi:hypothetical protein